MRRLLVATGNQGKLRELRELLAGSVEELLSLADFPNLPAVDEDGATFAENAVKKARAAALATGLPAVADDSGLVVTALGGQPGVLSARYAGETADDAANNAKLLQAMASVPSRERTAAFHCVIAFCQPDGSCATFAGQLPGLILPAPAGSGGFGYDPLFLVPEYGKTLAELSLTIKNRISHRGRAFEAFASHLKSLGT
ncbi:MAG TPA: XTP/dITP diphosphatase [Geobacteraceae bacterium]